MTTIIVADDHDLVRMGLVRMLRDESHLDVIGEASSGEQAVQMVRDLKPTLALMDIRMPGIGGLEATKKIMVSSPETKVIAVSAVSDDIFPERLIKAGACGYVTKGAGFDDILKAIEVVVQGGIYMSPAIAQQLALRNVGQYEASPFDILSERELQTSVHIAKGKKVQQIADTFCVSPKTVNSYRYRIFEKLQINSDVELALLAVKHKVIELDE